MNFLARLGHSTRAQLAALGQA
ncbi:MAG: hypothetical protein RL039_935, partial [Pseudomonadota bacterium]